MKPANIPSDEAARLAALREYGILDTEPEIDFDEIARLATYVCDTPMSLISLVDHDRQWFKAHIGLDTPETSRDVGFCPHAILQDDVFVVEDAAADDRFHDNPLVTGPPHIRFYAGAPLITSDGRRLGTLCVIDDKPRQFDEKQRQALRRLGRQVIALLEFRRAEARLRDTASISRAAGAGKNTSDRWRFWPALLFLLGGLLLTVIAARIARNAAMRGEEQRFHRQAEQIASATSHAVQENLLLMNGAADLWTPQHAPAASDWRRFFTSRPLSRYPSISGLGLIRVVPRSQLESFSEAIRGDYGEWAAIHPPVDDDVAYVVRLIEPVEIARATIGFNIATVPLRRAAAERARDEKRPILTPPTKFDGKTEGVILYRPVFLRSEHAGWVYALIRAKDVADQVPLGEGMRFSLYDGSVSPATRLFTSNGEGKNLPFRTQQTIPLLGRNWIAVSEGSPDLRVVQRETEMTSLAGVLVTFLFTGVVVALNSTRRRALQLAGDMTSGLRDSESRMRSIVEHIAEAVIAFPAGGALEAFNPAAERLFGFPPATMIGRDVATILPSIGNAPKDGTTMQTVARRSDGSEIPVELAVKPVPNDHRSLTVAIVRDISGRLADQERLQASEERYRDLFENSTDLIHSVDTDGRFLYANRAWLQTLGYDEADLPRLRVSDVMDPLSLARCTGTFDAIEGVEAVFRTRDGRPILVEGNVSQSFDENGAVSTRGIWRDTTARKRAERDLENMIANADDVLYRCDARGRFTFINSTATRLSGYETSEFLGTSYLQLVRPDYREKAKEFYEQQYREKVANTYFEFPIAAKDGREIWVGQKVQPIVENGEITGYQGVARDVTERKRLRDELELARDAALESARLKSQFLATMSHEIRTPMNGVIGMVGLLLETDLTPEQRDLAMTVQTSADSLLTIINDVLDFSKIEAGKLAFERNEFDVTEVVDGSIELFVQQAREKGIEIAALVERDVPSRVRGDAGRLRQVLMNLISNAIKFTDAGDILVTACTERETEGTAVLRFAVADSGIGIEPDLVAQLFMPFVQADGTTTRRFGGTGLGLAICRQLVEMMNGEIGVESVPGQGSTFWFTAELEKQEGAEVQQPPFAHSARVLVVDQHETHRRVIRHQVESIRLRADTAASMEEALSMLRAARDGGDEFNVCIVDLHADASALANAARTEGFDVSLILATSLGRRREDLEVYRAAGFEQVLMKPVRRSQLIDCLASSLGQQAFGTTPHARPTAMPLMRRMRILVAEDNRINQRVVLAQLDELGHNAVAVGNGLEALAALDEIGYDAVLMDCQMPEMDGYEATALIRARKQFKDLPIIAMTANAMSGDRERCLAAGMDDYLTKPFGLAELAQALSRFAGRAAVLDPRVLADVRAISPSNPDFVRELIALFLEEAPVRTDALKRAIEIRDAEATWRAAHAFKSGCSNIGAVRLAAICDAIERHGRSGKIDDAEQLFGTLEMELPELEAMLMAEARG